MVLATSRGLWSWHTPSPTHASGQSSSQGSSSLPFLSTHPSRMYYAIDGPIRIQGAFEEVSSVGYIMDSGHGQGSKDHSFVYYTLYHQMQYLKKVELSPFPISHHTLPLLVHSTMKEFKVAEDEVRLLTMKNKVSSPAQWAGVSWAGLEARE